MRGAVPRRPAPRRRAASLFPVDASAVTSLRPVLRFATGRHYRVARLLQNGLREVGRATPRAGSRQTRRGRRARAAARGARLTLPVGW